MFRHTLDEIKLAISESRPIETQNRIFRQRCTELSVKDLRTILATNKNHADAMTYHKATADMDPDYKVTVDEVRLKAIMENRESRLKATVIPMEGGGWVTLVDTVLVKPGDIFADAPTTNIQDIQNYHQVGTTATPDVTFAPNSNWEDQIDEYDAQDHPQ